MARITKYKGVHNGFNVPSQGRIRVKIVRFISTDDFIKSMHDKIKETDIKKNVILILLYHLQGLMIAERNLGTESREAIILSKHFLSMLTKEVGNFDFFKSNIKIILDMCADTLETIYKDIDNCSECEATTELKKLYRIAYKMVKFLTDNPTNVDSVLERLHFNQVNLLSNDSNNMIDINM